MHLVSSLSSPRPTWTRFIGTLVASTACVVGVITTFAEPAHLSRGIQLVDEITAAQKVGVFTGNVGGATVFLNRYGGTWDTPGDLSFIRFFDQAAGTYAANYTTCAPLVTHLLKRTYNWDWKQYPISDPLAGGSLVAKASPKSYLYVSAIKTGAGFALHVTNLLAVLPGDIGARWELGSDEGHTMIVVNVNASSAKSYPQSSSDVSFVPELAGALYYEVTVLDSSASGHSNDTRLITYAGKTELSGGAGTGVIGVFTNAAGQVIAHTWSLPASSYLTTKNGVTTINPSWLSGIKSRLKKQADVELVFGRLPTLVGVP